MNVQYLNTLQDKTKKRLLYLADYIAPKLSKDDLQSLLGDLDKKKGKTDFIELGKNKGTAADLSKLNGKQLEKIYQIFISKEINDKIAVKWRLYQFLKYSRDINIKKILMNRSGDSKQVVDIIIETDDNEKVFFACFEILDRKTYDEATSAITKFAKQKKQIPDKIIFAPNKTYRNIPIDNPIKIDKKEIISNLWVEFVDDLCPFNGIDLLLVDNLDLNVAGFNFTNIEDLLDYIYLNSEGGQIAMIKQPGFFSEYAIEESEKELIWKGIMIKNNI